MVVIIFIIFDVFLLHLLNVTIKNNENNSYDFKIFSQSYHQYFANESPFKGA